MYVKHIAMLCMLLLTWGCSQSHEHELPPATVVYQQPDEPIPEPRPEPRPGFQTIDINEDSMILDAQRLTSQAARDNTAYLIGCDRSNIGQNLNEFQQGVNRGINLVSTSRELFKPTTIGPNNCIYRIELDQIGWTKADWDLVASNDILNFQSNTVRGKNLQFLLQKKRPYAYASSFLLTAMEADSVADRKGQIYYRLLRQDTNTTVFFNQQGVDVQRQINDIEAIFSGFSESQIALQKSRLVIVFESSNGICIETQDTALGGDDLFKNSFTPELSKFQQINGNIITNKIFQRAASEVICTLNNGLFGEYRLHDKADIAQSVAPTNVVVNLSAAEARLEPAVRLGDCSNCHYKAAAIAFRDQIRNHILGSTAYNENEKKLANNFFKYDRITAVMDQLNRENTRLLESIGVTAGVDPLWNVVFKPSRQEWSIEQVAGITWLDTSTFEARLRGSAVSSQVFGNLLNGGKVSLAILSANFSTLINELQIYEDGEL